MSLEKVKQELLEGGLHEESVERLLNHYQSMQRRIQEGEYDEAGTHIGNFCENMVNILLDAMGESVEARPDVTGFVNGSTSGKYGTDEPKSIWVQVPNVIRAAYDIRNNRDSVHVNLQVPVNHADTQAGIAMCSWMLAEVLRVYGDGDETDNMEQIGALIEELSEPVTEGNPLRELETSSDDFDRRAVRDALDGLVQINGGGIHPSRGFSQLATAKEKVIVLLVAQRAAVDIGATEQEGLTANWISSSERADVTSTRVRQIINEYSFIYDGENNGEYHIPGFRVEEALDCLEAE
ncbi:MULTISPECIES: hypothetical protein [unclassified Haloferax]|uniref:hypothetical protein n=1 Tax=unclassified Haloferax TaxID=2625095 RepID=UPI000E22A90E|nr:MULTISPECIES: hypothetical protein [unclassified Haloferax]RDZ33918.1 hypothetical protein C5B88_14665 [Haloferax sp. Atlit-24N]RLM33523.1 hypothetical protein DVK03_17730 [Haloferax sp. Atlit-109R]RLM40899.1 hypothetical protein DVK04_18590 [Haloferax sp. Atlit-105R]